MSYVLNLRTIWVLYHTKVEYANEVNFGGTASGKH